MAGIAYLETSAAVHLLTSDDRSPAILETVTNAAHVASSRLLELELRLAGERGLVDAAAVSDLLDGIALLSIDDDQVDRAATSGWGLDVSSALHLAAALTVEADQFVMAPDGAEALRVAATLAGMTVIPPGQ